MFLTINSYLSIIFVNSDLKPENIGFDANETVKIFDFGLARVSIFDDDDNNNNDRSSLRMMTRIIGTPRYMAPEVARGESNYGMAVDVYSFSIVLWQLVTNCIAYHDIRNPIVLKEKVSNEYLRPSSIAVPKLRLVQQQRQTNNNNKANNPSRHKTRTTVITKRRIRIPYNSTASTDDNDGDNDILDKNNEINIDTTTATTASSSLLSFHSSSNTPVAASTTITTTTDTILLQELIESCWSNNPKKRPTFSMIRQQLELMIQLKPLPLILTINDNKNSNSNTKNRNNDNCNEDNNNNNKTTKLSRIQKLVQNIIIRGKASTNS